MTMLLRLRYMDTEIEGRFGILEPIRWPFRYSLADSVVVSVFSGRFGGRFGILGPIVALEWPVPVRAVSPLE